MTRLDRQALSLWIVWAILTASLVTATAMHDWGQQQVEAATEQAKIPLVPPLNESKLIEVYERSFYEANSSTARSVSERHKFAMGAVQTAASRYHQLNQEIAKYDAP